MLYIIYHIMVYKLRVYLGQGLALRNLSLAFDHYL